jgi:hypothetical protein
MSFPISCTDCSSISNFSGNGSGSHFLNLKDFFDNWMVEWRKPATLGYLGEVLLSVDELCRECSQEGWDGYDAVPISEEACDEAKKFIKSLPVNFPMPKIVPEPGGEIGLEWTTGRSQVFVASVRGKNEIIYAGLFGTNKTHGSEYFGGFAPAIVIQNVNRLYAA